MANHTKSTMILTVAALLLSLLLLHLAESRVLPKSGSGDGKIKAGLICTETYAAVDGDTCFSIAKSFNLTSEYFSSVNPNLDCDKIFVAQWLCIDAVFF